MVNRRSRRGQKALVLGAGLAAALLGAPGFLDWSSEEAKEQLDKTVKVWKQPHSISIAGKDFAVDTVSQGAMQWQVRAREASSNATAAPALFAAREDGGNVVFGVNYDSAKSNFKPLKDARVSFSGTGDEEGNDLDWTLKLEGGEGRHFSMTGNSDDIVYDGSFGVEKVLKNGVGLLYSLDAKRRSGASGFLPSWLQSSAGLKYSTKYGDAKMLLFQPEPDSEKNTLEYEASWKGKMLGLSHKKVSDKILTTDPQYNVKLTDQGLWGKIKAPAKLGTSFGAEGNVDYDGTKSISGYAAWDGKRELVNGLELGIDAKTTLKRGNVSLAPVGLTLTGDMGKLTPKLLASGSKLELRTRYKVSDETGSVQARMELHPAKVPEVKAVGDVTRDTDGDVTGTLRVQADELWGMDARYELAKNHDIRQAAELRLPRLEMADGSFLRGTGKFYKGSDFGEKPRVQLGVQYEGNVRIMDKDFSLGGSSAAFDSGRNLLDEMGKPWKSPELKKARNSAKVLRNRIKSEFGEGRKWMTK
ncbi:unnamed protein product [Effrenium voratum]|nr:unnamed protein product [Effrenium voratum]